MNTRSKSPKNNIINSYFLLYNIDIINYPIKNDDDKKLKSILNNILDKFLYDFINNKQSTFQDNYNIIIEQEKLFNNSYYMITTCNNLLSLCLTAFELKENGLINEDISFDDYQVQQLLQS